MRFHLLPPTVGGHYFLLREYVVDVRGGHVEIDLDPCLPVAIGVFIAPAEPPVVTVTTLVVLVSSLLRTTLLVVLPYRTWCAHAAILRIIQLFGICFDAFGTSVPQLCGSRNLMENYLQHRTL